MGGMKGHTYIKQWPTFRTLKLKLLYSVQAGSLTSRSRVHEGYVEEVTLEVDHEKGLYL